MDVSISNLTMTFGFVACIYMILAFQVHWGFPPLYRSLSEFFGSMYLNGFSRKYADQQKKFLVLIIPFFFGIMLALTAHALTEHKIFFLAFGIISAWAGLRVRKDLLKETGGPRPWLRNRLTAKWPMLPFDVWTLTFCLSFGWGMIR